VPQSLASKFRFKVPEYAIAICRHVGSITTRNERPEIRAPEDELR
jgi:hypothetical protein